MTSKLTQELAARQPWLYAEDESWWLVTGSVNDRHTFSDCIAQVVPAFITGVEQGDGPALFKVITWGDTYYVSATRIIHAERLVFVMAKDPGMAYYADEQEFIAAAEDAR